MDRRLAALLLSGRVGPNTRVWRAGFPGPLVHGKSCVPVAALLGGQPTWFPDTEAVEFYDLQEDSQEMYNRGSEPSYRKQIANTQTQLNSLMTDVGVSRDCLIKKMGNNSKLPPRSHKKRKKK